MVRLITILILLIFVSCGPRNDNKALNEQIDSEKVVISDLDSIVTDSYIITFQDAKPFKMTDIYGDLNYRLQLTDTIDNWHNRAKKVQDYLQTKYLDYFETTDSTLIIKLMGGKIFSFPFWDNEKEEGYNFEHYFKEVDYYLLYVQWYEGNCWLMINRKSGFSKKISGLPYFSRKNDKFLTINTDLEAGYSFNGIELYSLTNDTLRNEFSKETTWGPSNIKWINDNQFLIKREHFHVDSVTGIQENKIDFKLATIKKKVSH